MLSLLIPCYPWMAALLGGGGGGGASVNHHRMFTDATGVWDICGHPRMILRCL